MSVEWPYAKLAKLASKYGGPEKLMALVKSRNFQKGVEAGLQEGVKAGRIQMIPVALGTLVLGVLGTLGIKQYQKNKYSKLTKCKVTEAEAAKAEDLLIKGMKAAEQDKPE